MELICPLCGNTLAKNEKQFVCPNRHSYDIARKGYVNLLPVSAKSSTDPGDNKDMIKARRLMMEKGYYSALTAAVVKCAERLPHGEILDLGCGEGVMTRALAAVGGNRLGLDISKHAVEQAATQDKAALYAVASCNKLPLGDDSVDLAVNCFAPLKESELLRVLKPTAHLIKVTPAPMHLFELKVSIYPKAYPNEVDETPWGFEVKDSFLVQDKITVEGETLDSLLKMTPYFYTTPRELLEKVKGEKLTVTLAFAVRVLSC